jgi:hypothetical protein
MDSLQFSETLSLVHAHARKIYEWRRNSLDPGAILAEDADLRDRAERLYGLVLALVGPRPKPPKLPRKFAPKKSRKTARIRKRR